jgi:general secretion pathway protein G
MLRRLIRNEKGFTMVEMMVVMIIIAVLIAGGVKFYQGYIENSKVTKAKAQISTMQAALDAYYAENGKYPSDDTPGGLKAKMLNAGLIVTDTSDEGTEGQECTLNVADPWGASSFYIYKSTDSSNFHIRTGWNSVQGQDDTYVVGRGSNGTSNAPEVGKLTES